MKFRQIFPGQRFVRCCGILSVYMPDFSFSSPPEYNKHEAHYIETKVLMGREAGVGAGMAVGGDGCSANQEFNLQPLDLESSLPIRQSRPLHIPSVFGLDLRC